ncbi:hypothetical protein ACUKBL_05915 [Furfurilactobacillus rossiae]
MINALVVALYLFLWVAIDQHLISQHNRKHKAQKQTVREYYKKIKTLAPRPVFSMFSRLAKVLRILLVLSVAVGFLLLDAPMSVLVVWGLSINLLLIAYFVISWINRTRLRKAASTITTESIFIEPEALITAEFLGEIVIIVCFSILILAY